VVGVSSPAKVLFIIVPQSMSYLLSDSLSSSHKALWPKE